MFRVECRLSALLCGLIAVFGPISCGGGPSLPTPPQGVGTLEVHVSAGAPVSGADVSVYALVDSTGQVQEGAGNKGVIGTGGPTDADGKAVVKFTTNYSGPVQVVASGGGMSYPDPTAPESDGKPSGIIQIGSDFALSSYLPSYAAGTSAIVAVDLFTSLADHEALAYARGLHPLHPGRKKLSASISERDQLFVKHVCQAPLWDPRSLRSTIPAPLTSNAQTMGDISCAAFPDLALNWLAHDLAGSGNAAFNAIALTQLLEEDLDADGVLDGKGAGGSPLQISGSPSVTLDAQTLRLPLATALDEFMYRPDVNKSGVTRVDLRNAGVFDNIANDNSDLFGTAPAGSFVFQRIPPSVAFSGSVPGACNTALKLQVTAKDAGAGVSAVWVQVNGTEPVQAKATETAGIYETDALELVPGANSIVTWAVDNAGTSGQGQPSPATATATITFDTQAPAPDLVRSFASYYDERGLSVATSNGVAVIPAQYDCSTAVGGCSPTTIADHGIFKVATRLGWTSTPTAAVLEGVNPDNIPVLQWKVPYNAATDAAIIKATYSVAVSCTDCGYPTATGDLWPSTTTSMDAVYFDLPIASNLIPALQSLPGAATLAITVTVSDAAGNVKTTDPISLSFHLLGPPLAITDAGFGGMTPDASSYQCSYGKDSALSYYNMWSAAPLRLRHYVVSNPHGMSVAFSQPSATWTNHEYWKAGRVEHGPSDAPYGVVGLVDGSRDLVPPGGTQCSGYDGWHGGIFDAAMAVAGTMPSCADSSNNRMFIANTLSPVNGYWKQSVFLDHYENDERSTCMSSDPGMLGDWGSYEPGGSVATTTAAYIGGVGVSPNSAGHFIIPPASSGGGAPGLVDVYLVLPSISRRPAGFPTPTQESPPFLSPQDELGQEYLLTTYAVPLRAVFVQAGQSRCDNGAMVYEFTVHIDYEYLGEAYDDVIGSWSLQTAALDQNFKELGELWEKAAMDINVRITHDPGAFYSCY